MMGMMCAAGSNDIAGITINKLFQLVVMIIANGRLVQATFRHAIRLE